MDCKKYNNQLLELLINEDKITFFCDLIDKVLWDDYSARKELIDYVISFCEENGLDEGLAWMYYFLGWHYYELSNYKSSINLINIAKDIFIKNDNKKGLVHAYNGLIAIYCQNGQYELANELGASGISIAKEINEKELVAKLLLNTSITNILSGSYEYAKEILQYIVLTHDYEKLSDLYKIVYNKALAEAELNTGNLKSAYKCLQYAIENNNKKGINVFTSELYKLLGCYYSKTGQCDNAHTQFEYSCNIAAENKNLFEKCETLIEWSKFRFDYGDNENAVILLDEAVKISDENNFYRIIKIASMLLYDYYNKTKDFKKALANLELYLKADNEIQNYNNSSYIGKGDLSGLNKELKLYRILYDKTEILSSLGQKIISTLDVKKMIADMSSDINKIVKVDYFAISVYDKEKDELLFTALDRDGLNIKPPIKVKTSSTFGAYCVKTKKPIVINDIRVEYKKYVNKISLEGRGVESPLSNIYLPLMIKDEIVGVMTVQSLKVNAYTTDDVNRLKIIANYIAIALKNGIMYNKIEQVAVYDSLTGFLTKREILKVGNIHIEKYKNSQTSFCLLMIDIDDFKKINDTYGHVFGDQILKVVTQTIGKRIRVTDFIGRYGGDEFLVICPNTTINTANQIAERIRKTVENKRYMVNKIVIKTSVSIGIYEFKDVDLTLTEGIKRADAALYDAKNSTKNRVVTYE